MNVPFYGHVKQYHGIKNAIDARVAEVLESGQYVMGPMLKRFEGAGGLSRHEVCRRRRQRHRCHLAGPDGAGHRPGRRSASRIANTFFATAEAIWIAGATAVFVDCDPRDQVHRSDQDRSRDHARRPRPSSRSISTANAPT